MDLDELKQFVMFDEAGTLSKVADEFHISTPSVTRTMKKIEDIFGISLFNRSKNRIELNDNGKLAVEYARKLLDDADNMVERVREYDARKKTIVIKSCAPAPLWELIRKMGSYHSSVSGMTISSSVCQNDEVIQALIHNECDIGILPYAISLDGWNTKKLMQEHLFVCVPKEHELAQYEKLSFKELNGFNFLIRSEIGFWDTICRNRMPASKFLVQTDEEIFKELIKESSLPCFTTDYINIDSDKNTYHGRVNIPVTDDEVNVQFYMIKKTLVK